MWNKSINPYCQELIITTLQIRVEGQINRKLLRAAVPNDAERQVLKDADGENFDDLLEEIPPEMLQKLIDAKNVGVMKALERRAVMEHAQG